jgi:hypothetical protein
LGVVAIIMDVRSVLLSALAVPINVIQRFLSPYASRHLSQGQTCHMRDTRGFSSA